MISEKNIQVVILDVGNLFNVVIIIGKDIHHLIVVAIDVHRYPVVSPKLFQGMVPFEDHIFGT